MIPTQPTEEVRVSCGLAREIEHCRTVIRKILHNGAAENQIVGHGQHGLLQYPRRIECIIWRDAWDRRGREVIRKLEEAEIE